MEVKYINRELSRKIEKILHDGEVVIAEPRKHETAGGGTHTDSHVVSVIDLAEYRSFSSVQNVAEYLGKSLSSDPDLIGRVKVEVFAPIHPDACALALQVGGKSERVILRKAFVYV